MVLRESGALVVAGIGIGVALAALAARWIVALLYGLDPIDPASYVLAVGVLALVSIVAAWVPARRASLLTPTVALRE
jgi:ABC-type antimicrobial peptide transport system permease subunit